MTSRKLSWLHFSDLHAGMPGQTHLWPTVKQKLFDDLGRLHDRCGDWDLVIFSGDLTQRGARPEFDEVDRVLDEMWDRFLTWGFEPKLFAVPGNHDICRPSEDDPEIILLREWFERSTVQNGFFSNPTNRYKAAVDNCFSEYSSWIERRRLTGHLVPTLNDGLLPGDQSAIFCKNNISMGLIGLNSTWLQLTGHDATERLHVDVAQIQAITGNNAEGWSRANDVNLLVTHQPESWLHPSSRATWDSEVNPPWPLRAAPIWAHASALVHVASRGRLRGSKHLPGPLPIWNGKGRW